LTLGQDREHFAPPRLDHLTGMVGIGTTYRDTTKSGENMESLSVAIITKNEEHRLSDCLRSAAFADDILVVDSGSTDGTIGIARSFGARVMEEPWRGYGSQKQLAVDQCMHDWVLVIDADERIPGPTAHKIRMILGESDRQAHAFGFRRKNYLHGKWIRHCGWWPDRVVRLVDRRHGCYDDRKIHEQWVTKQKVFMLDEHIDHYSFSNYTELVTKMNTYSDLTSDALLNENRRANPLTPVFHGLWMFLTTYMIRGGFLDGFDGLVISLTNAGGSFLKYAKLRFKQNCRAPEAGR
jgi:(heptosyl)LPS beta-1,4-glucosyltransferase